jgi:hypothetical protein
MPIAPSRGPARFSAGEWAGGGTGHQRPLISGLINGEGFRRNAASCVQCNTPLLKWAAGYGPILALLVSQRLSIREIALIHLVLGVSVLAPQRSIIAKFCTDLAQSRVESIEHCS